MAPALQVSQLNKVYASGLAALRNVDLDVASELTNFTSKQILLQAGVSMLAQAQQLPQNLLRLFQ